MMIRFLKYLIFTTYLTVGCLVAPAQVIKSLGTPNIANYSKNDYNSSHQVWDIQQGLDGVMYFATFNGLVEYDGSVWKTHLVSKNTNLRCLSLHKGKLFSGGIGTFGFWERQVNGEMVYNPIVDQTDSENEITDEFWRVFNYKGKLYAQSFQTLYVYDQAGMVSQIQSPGTFQFSFVVNDRLFIQDKEYGVYEVVNDKLELLVTQGLLNDQEVWGMFRFGDGDIIIATLDGRLSVLKATGLEPWENDAADFLRKNSIFSVELLDEEHIAVGTILNGVVILDAKGHIVQHINKTKGLQNNTVLCMYFDKQKNLWLGLDSGVSFVETNSPFTHIRDQKGTLGAVYTTIVHGEKLYVGTNQGLFWIDLAAVSSPLAEIDFRFQEATQGQVWCLTEFGDELICGHNKGTFRIGKKTEQVSTKNGSWIFRKWPTNDSIYISGSYSGLSVLVKKGNKPTRLFADLTGFSESSRFVEIDKYDNIWVSHPLKGLYRLRLNKEFTAIVEKEYYGSKTAIGEKADNCVLKFEDEVVFSTVNGIFSYDVIKNDFKPHDKLNALMGKTTVAHFLPVGDKTWYANDRTVGYVEREGNSYVKVQDVFQSASNEYIPSFNNIFSISDSVFSVTSYAGLSLLHRQLSKKKRFFFNPMLTSLKAISTEDTLVFAAGKELLKIPSGNNFIQVEYTSPNYDKQHEELFYTLTGDTWLKVSGRPLLISNLKPGAYSLSIKVRYKGDEEYVSESISFRILKPWFLTWWAMVCWVLLLAGAMMGFRFRYKAKLKREQALLQMQKARELKQQQEGYEHDALLKQQRIMLLEKEQLESEVRFKSKELANMVITNIDKNEVLTKIKNELERIHKEGQQKFTKKNYTQLIQLIDQHLSSEDDWNVFEMNFNKAYEGFFKKIKNLHPVLTPNDLRLSAYLRMNLSSKEIAPLLNISVRSVEVSRYRLRKKLEIDHDKNLIDYMLEI